MLSLAWDRLIYNSDVDTDDPQIIQAIMAHIPGGVGIKNLFHFAQTYLTGEFRDWDYSLEYNPPRTNMEAYGTKKPPLIDVKQVRQTGIPMAMFIGFNDELVSFEDSHWLYNELQNGYGDNHKPVIFYK